MQLHGPRGLKNIINAVFTNNTAYLFTPFQENTIINSRRKFAYLIPTNKWFNIYSFIDYCSLHVQLY